MADLWLNYGYLNLNLKWNYGRTMAELLQFKFRLNMELWLNYGWIKAVLFQGKMMDKLYLR